LILKLSNINATYQPTCMQNLSSLFDTTTGLYTIYKWCRYNQIPKELFNLILLYTKNYPPCIHCSLKCCKYDSKRISSGHANNNVSLISLVGSLIDKYKQNPNDKATIGKIILIAYTKNESTQIPHTIKIF